MSTRLHRSEVRHQIDRIARAGGPRITRESIEGRLGYPLVEASMDELRGIVAGLTAVFDGIQATTVNAPNPGGGS